MVGQPSRGTDCGAIGRQPGGLLGEEHQCRSFALGSTDGDEQCDGDALGVFDPVVRLMAALLLMFVSHS